MSYRSNNENDVAKIIGIQFGILSPDEIRKSSVANITSRDTYVNNKPVIGGLFDPRMGVLDPGITCPTDGYNYMQTPGYFGHIELARPVLYIQYINTIIKIMRAICIKCSKLKIDKNKHKHILKLTHKKRWDYVFKHADKIKRCGDETHCGCGTKQPRKISREGLSNIIAEWDNTDSIKDENDVVKDKLIVKFTPEKILSLFRRISDDDINFMGFSSLWSRPEWFICQVLAVPPPAVRPSVKHDSQQRSEDDLSHILVNIIKANNSLAKKIQENASSKVIDDWTTVLQYYIATLVDNKIPGVASFAQRSGRPLKSVKERLNGKGGRVRGNLLGKRVDFSARSVITPDPTLKIKQVGVPIDIAKTLTVNVKVNKRNFNYLSKLVQNGPNTYPGANVVQKQNGEEISLKYVDRKSLKLSIGDIVHRHLSDGDPLLFNRQPSLHKMSMMCHQVKVLKYGQTIRFNLADTKPYNADFDGDEMNLHAPQSEMAQAELLHLAAVPRQIISPANNSSIIGIFQDSMLGAYRFTRENISFDKRHAMNLMMYINTINPEIFKKDKITNFELLSQILPPMSGKFANKQLDYQNEDRKKTNNIIEIINGEYKRGQIDKGVFGSTSKGLIHAITNDFDYKSAANFIDNIQSIINEYMKLSSYSVGISDLIADDETNNKISKTIKDKKQQVVDLIDQLHINVFENNTGKSNEVEFETKVNGILNKAQEEASKIGRKSVSADNKFVIMVNAGSKGSNINIAQMISCLGQQNVDGKRIPYGFEDRTLPHFSRYDDSPGARGFVESSFIQGLTPEELYFHAMGGREGLIDTAVKTSGTGYIQRRLIKGLEDLKVHYDMTVRNNKNKVIQFAYGDDNFNSTKCERQNLPITLKSLEEIYTHFAIPDSNKSSFIKQHFTKEVSKDVKGQHTKLSNKIKSVIELMTENREKLLKNVFKFTDNISVNVPVNFVRITNNVQNQFYIQKNSLIDITPLDAYKMIDDAFGKLMKLKYNKPTLLFKMLWYYHLSVKELLIVHRFNKKALTVLLETLYLQYMKSIVHPGEMVGMIAAQSIGEPTTQMTLNTFHFAGVASKSNVTRGVPRVEEILSTSDNPKNPSTTIYLKKDDEVKQEKAQEIKYLYENTTIRDITDQVSICYDPKNTSTLIKEDEKLFEEYSVFSSIMKDCLTETEEEMSKWVIRFKFSKDKMIDHNISMDDVNFAIKRTHKDKVNCVYSDFNNDNLIFRVKLSKSLTCGKRKSIDQSDEIYRLKNMQENILDNIVLKGINKIPKIILRQVKNNVSVASNKYKIDDIWVLDTVGSNFKDILCQPDIDITRTYSNNIQEVYRTLGIEAVRQCIYNEIEETFDANGNYINYHHLSLLCDRMCATFKIVSIFRHGINNDNIGPMAKASFEETPEMFLRAARHGELDVMTGVSANVMCGQLGYFGTGSCQVLLDIEKIKEMGEKEIKEDDELEIMLDEENSENVCSKQNIQITNTTKYIEKKDMGAVDDEYDPGF
jgi:DNA-directed RNA polymerase II subunit RPB1